MATRQVAPGLHQIGLGMVNAFLIEDDDGLVLIDTGNPGQGGRILDAIRSIGRRPDELRHILVTHCHPDHAGSLAELKRETGATCYMHPVDAELVRGGHSLRPLVAGPGLLNKILFRIIIRSAVDAIEPAEIDYEVEDGQELPLAGGVRAIHVPGHCAGQLAFLWQRHGGVLFAADACASAFGLAMSPAYEDLDDGRRSLGKLAAYDFELATFGHGRAITSSAAQAFRRKWPPASQRRDTAAA
jgi:glyoxylase-like metal-dependent hydrolase (beta-lactamase superfamily II)